MEKESTQNNDKKEFYQLMLGKIDMESNLLNQKFSTLINSQAFLFLGYVSLINSPSDLRADFLGVQHHLLLWLFPIVALLMVIFIYFSMISSHVLIKKLINQYSQVLSNSVTNIFSICPDKKLILLSNASIIFLPLLLTIAWVVLIILQYKMDV